MGCFSPHENVLCSYRQTYQSVVCRLEEENPEYEFDFFLVCSSSGTQQELMLLLMLVLLVLLLLLLCWYCWC